MDARRSTIIAGYSIPSNISENQIELKKALIHLATRAIPLAPTEIEYLFSKQKVCLPKSGHIKLKHEIVCKLLIKCSDNNEAVQNIWQHFVRSDKKKLQVIKHLPCETKRIEILLNLSDIMMSKLLKLVTPDERAHYLITKIKKVDQQGSLTALDSGEILPSKVALPSLIPSLLDFDDGKSVLVKLLKSGVDPCQRNDHQPSQSTMEILCYKCNPHGRKKLGSQKLNIVVSFFCILLENGANVEDLKAYHRGSRTSPLHVATEMALRTGNMDILVLVKAKESAPWVNEDKDNNTAVQIAQKSKSSFRQDVLCILNGETSELQPAESSMTSPLNKDRRTHEVDATDYDEFPKSKLLASKESTGDNLQTPDNPQIATHVKKKKRTKIRTKIGTKVTSTGNIDQIGLTPKPRIAEVSKAELKCLVEELLMKKYVFMRDERNFYSSKKRSKEKEQPASTFLQQIQQTELIADSDSEDEEDMSKPTFDDKLWEIEIHERVAEFSKNRKQPKKLHQLLYKKLHKLASGDWNIKSHKCLNNDEGIEIYEAKLTKAARILYQIALRFSEQKTKLLSDLSCSKPIHVYTQKIVVWEVVLDHDKINRSAKRVKDAIKKLKCPINTNNFILVQQFDSQLTHPQIFVSHFNPELQLEIESRLKSSPSQSPSSSVAEYDVGAKVYSLTTNLLFSFLENKNERRDYPIKATDEEHDIIQLPSNTPILVLGRSGTGKTTTCLNRLWLNFENWARNDINFDVFPENENSLSETSESDTSNLGTCTIDGATPSCDVQDSTERVTTASPSGDNECIWFHQLFITKSTTLCHKMKERFFDFVAGCEDTKTYLPPETEHLPDTLFDIQHFPIFITAYEFFKMLDKSLGDGEEFFRPGVIVESTSNQADDHSLSLLLEQSDSESDEEADEPQRRPRKCPIWREMTAVEFTMHIWPRIKKYSSDKIIDPLLVWTEIESFIKGSALSLDKENGYLTENEYLDIGAKRASNFPFQRKEVYKLFLEYEKEIKNRNIIPHRFDSGDLMCNLNKRLCSKDPNTFPWLIHELYIDEVQDFTEAELSVILKCCRHPERSFFAGDTAQTVMQGVAFRFEDLKTLFYNLKKRTPDIVVPIVHKLTTNHRSHSSITELANSLIDLLKKYFPDSFDWRNIPEDKSNILGLKPYFICSQPVLENFLVFSAASEELSSIEFGAHQVVITRDSSRDGRAKMPEYLRDHIVLNVQECKGLEFNAVILFNFFSDTPIDSQHKNIWAITAKYLEDEFPEVAAKTGFDSDTHPVDFDEKYHKSFCSELKMLYTIVTRAKCHLWIYEDSPPDKLPMIEYWYKRNFIEPITSPEHFNNVNLSEVKSSMTQKSSEDDWGRQGDLYMEKGLWHAAKKCYEKANNIYLATVANAFSLRSEALSTKSEPQFRVTAAHFIKCFKLRPTKKHLNECAIFLCYAKLYSESIRLLEEIEEYSLAIAVYKRYQRNDIETLVRLTERRGKYKSAIKLCLRKRQYNKALTLTSKYIHEGFLTKEECFHMLRNIIYPQIKTMLQSPQDKDSFYIIKLLVEIIPDYQEQVHILKQARLYKEACDILNRNQMYKNALRICRAHHFYIKGMEIAEKVGDNYEKKWMSLLQAEHQLVLFKSSSVPSLQCDVRQILEKTLTSRELLPKQRARAHLLLACTLFETDNTCALKYCLNALSLYKEIRNKVGEIEAFHLLTHIRDKTENHTVQHGINLLGAVEQVQNLIKLLQKPAAAFTADLHDIEDFYGLEKYGNSEYCIPVQQGYFLQPSQRSNKMDVDGMILVDQKTVLKQINYHFVDILKSWRYHACNLKKPWETKVKLSFNFHSEVQSKVIYLQKVHRMFPTKQIDEYLHMCEVGLQLSRINPTAIIEDSVVVPLQNLLSPFSQLSLPFQRENYMFIRKSQVLQKCLGKKFINIARMLLDNIEAAPNVDRWLLAWKVMHITGEDNVTMLKLEVNKQRDTINCKVQMYQNYDPSSNVPFTYTKHQHSSTFQSIFEIWELACQLYCDSEGKALVASRISFAYFVQIIARRRSLHKTVSTENLINILAIQSTALLAMISASKLREKEHIIFIIPESFELMTKTFNLIICNNPDHLELLPACLKTSQVVSPKIVFKKSRNFLIGILYVLTGFYRTQYNPLQKAIHHGTDTEAIHCLVLALTIFGNLVLYDLLSLKDCKNFFEEIITILQERVAYHSAQQKMVQDTYFKMASITNTKALFEEVIAQLLNQTDLKLMCLQTVTSLGKPKITIKTYSPLQISHTDFKWPLHEIPEDLLSYKHSATDSTKLNAHASSAEKLETPDNKELFDEDVLTDSTHSPKGNDKEPLDGHEGSTEAGDDSISVDHVSEVDIIDSEESEDDSGDDEESEDEEVIKELSAAAAAKVQPIEVSKPDPILEKEKITFLHENFCIVCRIELTDNEHFKSVTHQIQKKLYSEYNNAQIVYKIAQNHLIEVINECRDINHTDYELERAAMQAEQLIRSNNEEIAQQEQHFSNDWKSQKEKLNRLCEKTQEKLTQLKQVAQIVKEKENQESEHSEEEGSDNEGGTDELLRKGNWKQK